MADNTNYGTALAPPKPVTAQTGQFVDDISSETPPPPPRATAYGAPPANESRFVVEEVAGQPPGVFGYSTESGMESGDHEEIGADGSESGEEFAEASQEQMGESAAYGENAPSDLSSIEGFEAVSQFRPSPADAELLPDAGSATGQESVEFLPLLAKLVPVIASAAAPAIKRGIKKRLKPNTIKRLQTLHKGKGGLLALLAKLLGAAEAGEEAWESGAAETEADAAIAAEAAQMLEVIIGTDDRVRIRNTTRIPWRRLCALRITMSTGRVYRGTGFFIGPRTLATAGHCVYLHDQGGWARQIEVIPAADGSSRPYGSVVARSFRSVRGWVSSRRPEHDYGCIVLPPGAFAGRTIGSFGFAAFPNSTLLAKQAVLAGYPGDKPFAELWGMARRIKSVSGQKLVYDIDTMGGQSGSPVYIQQGSNRYVVGIHNYGASSGNSATRVNQAVFQNLQRWSRIGRTEASPQQQYGMAATAGW